MPNEGEALKLAHLLVYPMILSLPLSITSLHAQAVFLGDTCVRSGVTDPVLTSTADFLFLSLNCLNNTKSAYLP